MACDPRDDRRPALFRSYLVLARLGHGRHGPSGDDWKPIQGPAGAPRGPSAAFHVEHPDDRTWWAVVRNRSARTASPGRRRIVLAAGRPTGPRSAIGWAGKSCTRSRRWCRRAAPPPRPRHRASGGPRQRSTWNMRPARPWLRTGLSRRASSPGRGLRRRRPSISPTLGSRRTYLAVGGFGPSAEAPDHRRSRPLSSRRAIHGRGGHRDGRPWGIIGAWVTGTSGRSTWHIPSRRRSSAAA